MKASINVRLAGVADAPELARLNLAFNGVVESSDCLAGRLRHPQRVDHPILAEVDGRAVGFACLRLLPCVFYPEPYAELTELYVEPGWRRKGVARVLMAFAEDRACQSGARRLVLLTGPENLGAQAFYCSIGYVLGDVEMEKDL